ncbi:MAG: methylenetetrahydrofolate reductase [NAD(P)H] [Flavobacteriales bacterium]|nr:methylenetetrahydrofolate reductase [NAD(P)H] [Flavobacteriales bacterium]
MKVTEHISKAKSTLFSIEILPPLKGQNINSIFQTMDELMDFSPAFVDVTYHREEYVFRDAGNGLLEKQVVRKRPGTVGICAAISNRYKVDTVPHIICGGFSKQDTEDALIDLNFVGLDNVLVLRGDPIKSEGRFKPEPEGHAYAVDLVKQVVAMNKGEYLDADLNDVQKTNFCIGVAGYPEKHFEAPNRKSDLRYLKAKIDAGAEYIVTQMFYDNRAFFRFVDECKEAGINVPIIPGLKPLATRSQLNVIPHHFHINLPDELVQMVEKAKSDEEVRKIGVEWCIQQSKELMKSGVPVLHYYTMGKAKSTKEIAKAVF